MIEITIEGYNGPHKIKFEETDSIHDVARRAFALGWKASKDKYWRQSAEDEARNNRTSAYDEGFEAARAEAREALAEFFGDES